jgi:uncharacterized protein (DUF58 family)
MTEARLFSENFLRRLESLALLYRQAARSPMQGERRSAQRGQSVEFSDFRPYAPGDDFRRIDWNAYARLERLFLKLFVEEVDIHVHMLIDASRSMDWGEPNKLDFALRLAGALGFVALAGLDRVSVLALGSLGNNGAAAGVQPISRRLPAVRGKRSAVTLFSFLQSLQVGRPEPGLPDPGQSPGASPAAALNYYAASAAQPGPLLLFSDLMDDGWQPGLTRLAGKGFEITLLHILAPEEADPSIEGDYKLIDSEDGAEVEISANYDSLSRYRAMLADWQADWRSFCAARGMHYVPILTSESLEDLLFARLPQGGLLR